MAVAIIVLVAILYGGSLHYPLAFDDIPAAILNPSHLMSLGDRLWLGGGRSLSNSSFLWSFRLFGWRIEIFRLGNVIVHGLNALLLFALLLRLFNAQLGDDLEQQLRHRWLALIGAAWFAIHPVAVYSVAYLIERSMLLATFFALAAIHAWLCGLQTSGRRRLAWFVAALAGYAMAIAAKEHVVMLPLVIAALSLLLYPDKINWLRRLWPLFLAFAVIAVYAAIRSRDLIGSTYEGYALGLLSLQSEVAGRDLAAEAYSLSILTQGGLFFKYLALWLLPLSQWLSIDMHPPFATSWVTGLSALKFALFLAWPLGALWLLRRGGHLALAGLALIWPWLLFGTELATVRLQEIFVLYRSYVWMIALPLALPALLQKVPLNAVRALAPVLIAILLPVSLNRLDTFSGSYKLWDDAVKKSEERNYSLIGRAWTYRAIALIEMERYDEAMDDLDHALTLDPSFTDAYANRAVVFMRRHRWNEALQDCAMALALNPESNAVRKNRDDILRYLGNRKP